jgi:hypothetical protein
MPHPTYHITASLQSMIMPSSSHHSGTSVTHLDTFPMPSSSVYAQSTPTYAQSAPTYVQSAPTYAPSTHTIGPPTLSNTLPTLYTNFPTPPTSFHMSLKPPDVFTGQDPDHLAPFLTQCAHWFLAAPHSFLSERDRVLFAASYLQDLANLWWMPFLLGSPPSPILDSWALFSDELFLMFGNQHLHSTAQNALLTLCMDEDSRVSEYLVKFQSHLLYTRWNDAALAAQLYRGLPQCIKAMLQYIQCPQTFVDMCRHALDFDQRYWGWQADTHLPVSPSLPVSPPMSSDS